MQFGCIPIGQNSSAKFACNVISQFTRANRAVSKTHKTQCAAGVSKVPCTFKQAPLLPRRKIMPLHSRRCLSRRKLLLWLELCKCRRALAQQMKMLSAGACRFFLSLTHGDFIYICGGGGGGGCDAGSGGGAFIYCNAQTHLVRLHPLNTLCRMPPPPTDQFTHSQQRAWLAAKCTERAPAAGSPFRRTPKCIHSD